MKNLIKDFYESENNGFRVLVAPTGLGKTYAWTEAVCDMLSEEQTGERSEEGKEENTPKRRFIFVTPLLKNLPIAQLKEKILSRGIMDEDEFNRNVILLKSNADTIKENFPIVQEAIEKNTLVKRSKEYQDLYNALQFIYSISKDRNHQKFYEEIRRKTEEDFMNRTEPAFRRFLIEFFRKNYSTKKKRISVIENDPRWSWISVIYPGTFIDSKRVVFLSLDKFLFRNASIVGTTGNIWKSDLVKDACILIDEIDSTKEKIFDKIIERSMSGKNLLDLFITCYNALNGREVDELLDGLLPSESTIKDAENQKKNAQAIYSEFHLNHRFTLESAEDTTNFIFTAGDTHVVSSSGEKTHAYINHKGLKNVIEFSSKKSTDSGKADVKRLIDRLIGFKSTFQRWLLSLAISYRDNYNDRIRRGESPSNEMMGMEDAIATVVTRIFKSESWQRYFEEEILDMSFPSKAKRGRLPRKYDRSQPLSVENNPLVGESDRYDYDFLTNGFTYIEFENARRHNEDTFIQMYQCSESPEKIIVDLASRAKVIGLSATGDASTVLKNYDMDYLTRHLGVESTFFPAPQVETIKQMAKENNRGYEGNISIKPFRITVENAIGSAEWLQLFSGDERAYECADMQYLGNTNSFQRRRYLKICKVFRHFWANYDNIPLGYVMLNKIPKAKDRELDLNVLHGLFDLIIRTTPGPLQEAKSQDHVSVIAGEGFDEKKKKFFSTFLKDGKHKLIITAYNTAGAGQNLQYKIDPNDEVSAKGLVNVSGGDRRMDADGLIEVDANFIYLEKPTFVIQNKSGFSDTKTFFKALIQMTSLRESGSISAGMFSALLRDAFVYRAHSGKEAAEILGEEQKEYSASAYDAIYKSQDFLGAIDLICEQAIGRLCRTPNKRKNIFILLDSELNIGQCVNASHKGLTTPEFEAVCAISQEPEDHSEVILANKAMEHEKFSKRFIDRCLATLFINPEMQYNWQMVRDLVIKHPTADEAEYRGMSPWQQNFYIELPRISDRYWYKTSDMENFSDCRISFHEEQGYVCVSAEGSKLSQIMGVGLLHEHFEEKGYATEFRPQRYILCPIVYNNIYKGALGEFAGEKIMESIGYKLSSVRSDAYELFDYELLKQGENESTLCVDFKNWHTGMASGQNRSQLEHIASKAAAYGTRDVIIANLVSEGPFRPYSTPVDHLNDDGTISTINIHIVPALINGQHADRHGIEQIKSIVSEIRSRANETD